MRASKGIPPQRPGRLYSTEGGVETEIMYKWGYELPQFAMYPLFRDPEAVEMVRGIYRRNYEVAVRHGMTVTSGGFDYRASPDWGDLLGYSRDGLAETIYQNFDWLSDLATEYEEDVDDIYIYAAPGPRGDAYGTGRTITEDEAEDYHSWQIEVSKKVGYDFLWAMTFNNVPEAVGFSRAATSLDMPHAISLTLAGNGRLRSGPTLGEAIMAVDAATGAAPAFYTINCIHPVEYVPALEDSAWMQRIRGTRANASKMDKIALCKLGHLEEGDPIELGLMTADVARKYPHMDIWGGCCGTGHVHAEELWRNLRDVHPRV